MQKHAKQGRKRARKKVVAPKRSTSRRAPRQEGKGLKWRAPEYVYQEKTADWYWILGIIVVTIIVGALLLNNILFAIFALLAGATVALYGSRKPEVFEYEANEDGIKIRDKFYPYPTLEYFWIDQNGPQSLLIIESKKTVVPHILVPLENIDTNELRYFLENHMTEEYIERPWTQQIMDRIGF